MWQEIVTFLIIIAAAVYTVVKFLKNLRNGGGDCGCGGGRNCRSKRKDNTNIQSVRAPAPYKMGIFYRSTATEYAR